MSKQDIWVEKYRPKTIEDIIGQEDFKKKMYKHLKEGIIPNLLFYCPTPGTGKTTTGKVLIKLIGAHSLYINAADENNVEVVRGKIKNFAQTQSMKGKYKIVFLDEFSWFTKNAQSILFSMMEEYTDRCRFILTGNYLDKILPPILSRCQKYKLTPPNKLEVRDRLEYICKEEGINYSVQDLDKILEIAYPDIRDCIQELQTHCIDGILKLSEQKTTSNYYDKLIEILKSKSKSRFLEIRKLINENDVQEWEQLLKQMYLSVEDWAKGKELNCIIHLSRCTVDIQFIPQELKEIVFMECIGEILNEI